MNKKQWTGTKHIFSFEWFLCYPVFNTHALLRSQEENYNVSLGSQFVINEPVSK